MKDPEVLSGVFKGLYDFGSLGNRRYLVVVECSPVLLVNVEHSEHSLGGAHLAALRLLGFGDFAQHLCASHRARFAVLLGERDVDDTGMQGGAQFGSG